MPDSVRPAGRRLAAFAAVGLAVAVATCRDNPAGPAGVGQGVVNIEPVFSAGSEPANFGIAIDSIRAIVIRPPADTLLDRRVPFPADSSDIRLDLTVVLLQPVETLTVALEYRGGGVALFRGSQSVEVRIGAPSGTPPQPFPVAYVGPGALVDSLVVTPDDSVVTFGDSLRFRVAAFQAGVPVTQFYVSWTSSDAVNAPVNGFGVLRAPSRRDSVYVTARTPNGARDSTRVAFRPVPTGIARASGDGQSALLGSALPQPLRVRVTAADGLGVQQVPVRFRAAMGGGSVADAVAYTDGGGFAQTIATLGLMVGVQTFEASLTPTQFVAFSATALANTPTRLEFTTEPGTTLAGSAITPAVQVTARDAGGGVSTGFTGPITVALLANPGGGTLAGTTTVNAVSGVATFADLSLERAAAGYTLLATATGLTPDTSAAFTIDPRPATELAFTGQPTTATAGASITPAVVVTARDAFGNTATGFTGNVTLAIAANPGGGTLSGTATQAAVAGVATFSNLSIDRVGVGYALAASAGGLSGSTSAAFDITPGPAAQLAFTVQPSTATAGAAIAPAVVVTARDAQGNTATDFTGSVTVAIGTNPGSGTLSGTLTQSATAGVATFPGLSVNRTGVGYTLTAAATGLTGATSAAFDITPGAATQLAFSVQPATSIAGVAITPAVQVSARDALGNTATAFTGSVTVAIGTNPGSATLSGTATVAAVAGVASFANLSLDKVGTGYTLTASASGLTGATSATFDITPAAASQLAFSVQPTDATAGVAIAPAPVVQARDVFGNVATGFTGNVTVAIGTNPGSGTLSGTLTVAAAGGVASFGDLSIDLVGSGYTLTAAATGLTGATSGPFTITPAAASQLAFVVEPVTTVAGVAITPAMQVAALDAFGNTATSFTGTITLAIGVNPGGGALSGPATQAASAGVATFAGLSINRSGVGYTLTAGATGLTGATSAAFDVTPGAASQLVFTVQPVPATAGQVIAPAVEVTARDAQGNTATGFTGTVDIAIGANPGGGTLSGTTAQAAVAGVATFAGLSIDRSGVGYTLAASASGVGSATSAAFDIVAGLATNLAFTVQPANATAGAPITPAVVVTARDAFGNTATGFTGGVSIAIGANPSGGTLSGTTTVAAAAGVASFADLSIDLVGAGYTLAASASGLTGATSATFNVISSTATQLVFTVGPTTTVAGAPITPAIEVTARDSFGNTATGFTAGVTIVIGTNPGGGTLSGTATRAAVAGVATFPGLSINRTGTGYTLSAASGGLPPATSSAFDIVPGPATELVFTQQPVNTVAGAPIMPAVQVTARDAAGNLATGFTGSVAVAIGANPGGGTLSGTTSTAAVGGIASFTDLAIDRAATGYTLAASATGLTGATSTTFAITPAAASQLVFSVPPSNAVAGAAIAPAVQVTARDPFGNTATGFAGTVAVAIGTNPAGGTLSGTTSVAASAGVATFADLSIDRTGTGYTLTASATSLTGATSGAFDITPGAATQLVFTVEPTSVAAGNPIIPAVEVTALDAFGNTATGFTDSVFMAFATNASVDGVLFGTRRLTAVAGVATFADLSVDLAAAGYTLEASATGLVPDTSARFDVAPGAASQVAFTAQPTDVLAGAVITPAVQASVQDAFGNIVTSSTATIALAITAGTGTPGAVLGGTLTRSAVGGTATFDDLTVDQPGTGYTFTGSATGLSSGISAAFAVLSAEVARYELDGNGQDASGNGRHGTVTGTAPATDRFGVPGAAMHFSGGTDGIEVPADSGLSDNTMTELTLVAWVRTTTRNDHQRLVSKGAPFEYNYSLFTDSGRAAVTAWQFAGAGHLVARGPSVADGKWHQLVGTIVNGVAARIYVDGVLQATDAAPVGTWHRGGSGALQLGRHPEYLTFNTETLVGDLDGVQIIRRALTDAEVAALYTPGTLPDLVPTLVSGPASGMAGQAVPVTVTAYNLGFASVSPGWLGEIRLSADSVCTSAAVDPDALVYTETVSLAPGDSTTATRTATIPAGITPGTYYWCVILDPAGGTVTELDETNNTMIGNPITIASQTVHSADITANETWTAAQNPHVVTGYLRVLNNAVLTIEDGAEVRFDANAGLQVGDTTLGQSGGLVMQGTPGTIRLTANTASPTPGFWRGLEVQRGLAVPAWRNVVIEYGGAARPPQTPATEGCVLVVNDQGQPFTMDSVKIRQCVHAGIHLFGGNLTVRRSSIDSVTGSGIHVDFRGRLAMDSTRIVGSGQEGLLVASPLAGLTTNEFNKFLGNGTASVRIQAPQLRGFKQQDSIAGNGLLPGGFGDSIVVAGGLVDGGGTQFRLFAQAAPYLVLGQLKMVNAPVILMPGLVMAFDQVAGFQFGDSTAANAAQVNSQGTAANPVRLTSRSGAPGWPGLYLGRQSGPDTLTNVRIENGGYLPSAPSLAGNLVVDAAGSTGPVRIVGMRSTDSRSNGIVVRSAPSAGVRVLNDTITGSAGFGVLWMAAAGAGDSLLNVQTSGNGYPAYTMPMSLPAFLANDFIGNVRDTLLLTGGTLAVPATLPHYAGAPWRVLGSVTIDGGALTVGADTVFFDDSVQIQVGKVQSGGLRVVGTTPWRKLFTATPGHLQWWGILYGNVTPGGASAFTTLNNVVIEKAGHLEPCFGDCGPTPFGAIRYYNQSSEPVAFDSIVVRWSFAHALDVQPTGTGGLTVLRSQFYANQYFPMIKGPETPGNGAKLAVQFSDLYAYGYQAISSIYTGGAADTVDATNNWWGDVTGVHQRWAFQDSLGRAVTDFAAVRVVPFASMPHFTVGSADSLAAIRDTLFFGSPSIGDELPLQPPTYTDSLRVRTLDVWGRGVGGQSVTWTPTTGSVILPIPGPTDLGGRSPGIRWATSTVAGPHAVSAAVPGLAGSPVNFRANLTAGTTVSVDWEVLPGLTTADSIKAGGPGVPDTVFYSSSNRPTAVRTNARDSFGNVTHPTSTYFFTTVPNSGFQSYGVVDTVHGDTVEFRPLVVNPTVYQMQGLYDFGAMRDSMIIVITPTPAGVLIDRDPFQFGIQDTTGVNFLSLCGPADQTDFYCAREFSAYAVDSGGAPIGNDNAFFTWRTNTAATAIDVVRGAPASDTVTVRAHTNGVSWLVAEDIGEGPTSGSRDSVPILVHQVAGFMQMTPDSATVLIGNTATFDAEIFDISGRPYPGGLIRFRVDDFLPGRLTITDTSVENRVTVRLDSTPYGATYVTGYFPRPPADTIAGFLLSDTLFAFGAVHNPVVTSVAASAEPREVVVNPTTGNVFVGHLSSGAVYRFAGPAVLDSVRVGGSVLALAVNPVTNRVYATSDSVGAELAVINGGTGTVLTTIPLADQTYAVAVDTISNRIWATTVVALQAVTPFLVPIDGVADTVLSDSIVTLPAVGTGVAYNYANGRVYVAMDNDSVAVVNPATGSIEALVDVSSGFRAGSGTQRVAVNNVTNRVYVTLQNVNATAEISGVSNTVIKYLNTTFQPRGLAVNQAANLLYVAAQADDAVYVFDLAAGFTTGYIYLGFPAQPSDVAHDPNTGNVYVAARSMNELKILSFGP